MAGKFARTCPSLEFGFWNLEISQERVNDSINNGLVLTRTFLAFPPKSKLQIPNSKGSGDPTYTEDGSSDLR